MIETRGLKKSIRNGNLSLNEGFARVRDGELWLVNFTIPPYKEGSIFNHEPGRPRKLLLHKEQLERLTGRPPLNQSVELSGGGRRRQQHRRLVLGEDASGAPQPGDHGCIAGDRIVAHSTQPYY